MRKVAWITATVVWLLPAVGRGFYVEGRELAAADAGTGVVVLRWNTSAPVEYRLAPATLPTVTGDVSASIAVAFQTWQDVECATISFTAGTPITGEPDPDHARNDPDNPYILVFGTSEPSWWGDDLPVGKFFFLHDETDGHMRGGYIVLNKRDHAWSTDGAADTLDVQSVVTALVGRALGITSNTAGNATYPSYRSGNIDKRTLGTDDVAAIVYLYADESNAACSVGDPEAICEEYYYGGPVCPPEVVTNPPDGGTGGGLDGGGLDGDGSATPPLDTSEDCSCAVAGRRTADLRGVLLLAALAAIACLRRWVRVRGRTSQFTFARQK